MIIRVIDTETTGIPTATERHAVCEIGFTDMLFPNGTDTLPDEIQIARPVGHLCNPGRPIPPEASAVHHIRDRDVADMPSPDRVFRQMYRPEVTHFAAHKAEFDQQFYSGGDKPWLCTLCAMIMHMPDAPNYQNQTLRYILGIDDEPDFDAKLAFQAHRAADDTYITAFNIRALLRRGLTVAQIVEWTSKPLLLPKFNFGKFKGQPWSVADKGYLNWIMKSEMANDRHIAHTAKFWLRQ